MMSKSQRIKTRIDQRSRYLSAGAFVSIFLFPSTLSSRQLTVNVFALHQCTSLYTVKSFVFRDDNRCVQYRPIRCITANKKLLTSNQPPGVFYPRHAVHARSKICSGNTVTDSTLFGRTPVHLSRSVDIL